MAERDDIIRFLDGYLAVKDVKDRSTNGLQVEGGAKVSKAAFGVSASRALFEAAGRWGAQMVVVHHGMLWGKSQVFKGPFKARVQALLQRDMTLLAYHLPLDLHPEVGNNSQILRYFRARQLKPFGMYDGQSIGFKGVLPKPLSLLEVCAVLKERLDSSPLVHPFGPAKVKTLGVISGGASDMVDQAAGAGLDLYVTGEPNEPLQEACREHGINCVCAGHYDSEKAGVLALADLVRRRFRVETRFIDVPNPT
ncbi:MAG: Nif3-like dinuclear metal center hexameric protein [Elusimicrobia bacterium]|nr:Nif3-like dinuclear metal center hexameric protein [Elusimicrobiota bacterium]